jgi:hypothetical protein
MAFADQLFKVIYYFKIALFFNIFKIYNQPKLNPPFNNNIWGEYHLMPGSA